MITGQYNGEVRGRKHEKNSYRIPIALVSCFLMLIIMSTSGTLFSAMAEDVEIIGAFYDDDIYLTVGDITVVEGEVMSTGSNLNRITYQIDGWAGEDENNRYCSQAVEGLDFVHLDEMRDLILDASCAPLDQPGMYTLWLVASTESGNWGKLDCLNVYVEAAYTEEYVESDIPEYSWEEALPEPVAVELYEEYVIENNPRPEMVEPIVTEAPVAELMGYFSYENITLTVGDVTTVAGEVGSKNYNLAQITYQIEGWEGTDGNNRYCTQAVSGANYVNLSEMGELVLNTNTAPLNQPGSYTLKLVARAEDGTWAHLSTMQVNVQAPESTEHSEPEVTAAPSYSEEGKQEEVTVDTTVAPTLEEEIYIDPRPAAELMGYFSEDSLTLTIGDVTTVAGEVGSKNYNLVQITYQIEGWVGTDDNNRYCTQAVSGTNYVNLSEMRDLLLNTNTAPLNQPGSYTLKLVARAEDGTWAQLDNMKIEICAAPENTVPSIPQGGSCVHSDIEVYDDYDTTGSFSAVDNSYHSYSLYVTSRNIYCNDCNTIVESIAINKTINKQGYHYFWPDGSGNMVCMDCGHRWNCSHSNSYVIDNKSEEAYEYLDSQRHVHARWVYEEMYPEDGMTYHYCPDCGEYGEGYSDGYIGWGISDLPMIKSQKASTIEAHTYENGVCIDCGYTSEGQENSNQGTKPDPTEVPQIKAELKGYFADDSLTLTIGEVKTVAGEVGSRNHNLVQITYQIDGWVGTDDNNRYCTQAVSGTNYVNLSEMGELVLNTNTAPLNQPGSYTLKLVARAEDGTWGQLDSMQVNVLAVEIEEPERPAAELMGYFTDDSITLKVGEVTTVEGEVGSKNYNLAQITYQIDGWSGIDENNRYCTQAVNGTNYVNLAQMNELALNTNAAPLNQPGSYTLKLVARAEDGTWNDELDSLIVYVEEEKHNVVKPSLKVTLDGKTYTDTVNKQTGIKRSPGSVDGLWVETEYSANIDELGFYLMDGGGYEVPIVMYDNFINGTMLSTMSDFIFTHELDKNGNTIAPGIYIPSDLKPGSYYLTVIATNDADITEVKIEVIVEGWNINNTPYKGAKGNTAENLIAAARSQTEYILNQGNAKNNKYGKYTGSNGSDWCAAFVSWCANEASVTAITKSAGASPQLLCSDADIIYFYEGYVDTFNDGNPMTLYSGVSYATANWVIKNGQKGNKDMDAPKPGDIVFFRWKDALMDKDPTKGVSISHVGIVTEVRSATDYDYIDGNGGGDVSEQSIGDRLKNVVCYATPRYSE